MTQNNNKSNFLTNHLMSFSIRWWNNNKKMDIKKFFVSFFSWLGSYFPHTLQGKSSFMLFPAWLLLLIKLPLFNWLIFLPMQWIRVCPCNATREEKLYERSSILLCDDGNQERKEEREKKSTEKIVISIC